MSYSPRMYSLVRMGGLDSLLEFYDDNSNTYRKIFWDDSQNDWYVEDNSGISRKLHHDGNTTGGGGGDADTLDGYDSTAFARKAENASVSGDWNFTAEIDLTGGIEIGETSGITGSAPAMLAIRGDSFLISGPHLTYEADGSGVVFQQLNWASDNVALSFDSYFNGTNWISSDAGSNFQIYKNADKLRFRYESGVATGSTVNWGEGLVLDSNGNVGIGTDTPAEALHVNGKIKIQDGTNSVGDVWTATSPDGGGAWMAPSGGGGGGDANTLDGFDSLDFARKAEDATIAGNWTIIGQTDLTGVVEIGETSGITGSAPAMVTLRGGNSLMTGPHVTYEVDGSPGNSGVVFQQLNWAKNNVALTFDAYYAETSSGVFDWYSSHPGSNFSIYKLNDELKIRHNSGTAEGATFNWSDSMTFSADGKIIIQPQGDLSMGTFTN